MHLANVALKCYIVVTKEPFSLYKWQLSIQRLHYFDILVDIWQYFNYWFWVKSLETCWQNKFLWEEHSFLQRSSQKISVVLNVTKVFVFQPYFLLIKLFLSRSSSPLFLFFLLKITCFSKKYLHRSWPKVLVCIEKYRQDFTEEGGKLKEAETNFLNRFWETEAPWRDINYALKATTEQSAKNS